MVSRQTPPGRTSISRVVVVKPVGPHHCPTIIGSVQALNTSSRGASKTGVMTSTRSAGSLAALFPSSLAAMFLLLRFQGAQIFVQSVEALLPESPVVLQPVGDALERARLQPAGPPLRFATARYQPRPLQYL